MSDKIAYVAAQGSGIGKRVAAALAAAGFRVALLADEDAQSDNTIPTDFSSRVNLEQACTAARALIGTPGLVVVSAMPKAAAVARRLVETRDEEWQASCRDIIRSTLYCLQAAHKIFDEPGTIIVLGPSFSFSGSADLVPLSTASEAQRGLVKSAARQWGERGIRLNWVGAHAKTLSDDFSDARLPFRPERIPFFAGRPLDLEADVVPLITFLASATGRNMSGASLCLDGGEWMLP